MPLLAVSDALDKILAGVAPLEAEEAPLSEAHGRVLTLDVLARRTAPPADVSAMDGYAVRAADVAAIPARLKLIGEVAAGHPFGGTVGPGEAARIFTGGLVPDGADTVIIQENTTRDGHFVIVKESAARGRNIRKAGIDFIEGDCLLRAGQRMSGRALSLAAAMNYATLPVIRRPRVSILATGDELVLPGSALKPGQIVHSNAYALAALASAEGAAVTDLGIVGDTLAATRDAINKAAANDADILVTTGGASVGEHDMMARALEAEGFVMSFWKVALRPGKPLMYGRRGNFRVLGLPGNPVSAFVCAFLFLSPLLRALSGRLDCSHEPDSATLGADLPANGDRQDYLRARLTQDFGGIRIVTPFSNQDSSLIGPLAAADCLIVRAPYAAATSAGSPCVILTLPF